MTDFILIALATAALTYLAVTPWSGFRLGRVVHCRRRSQAHRPCLTARNNKKPAWVVNEVVRLKAFLPHAGSITLAHTFNRLHGATKKMTVSKSFVTYTVRANLLAIVRLRHEAKHATPRAVARNAVWGIDMTGKTDAT